MIHYIMKHKKVGPLQFKICMDIYMYKILYQFIQVMPHQKDSLNCLGNGQTNKYDILKTLFFSFACNVIQNN